MLKLGAIALDGPAFTGSLADHLLSLSSRPPEATVHFGIPRVVLLP
jgi:hypothetical protein